jgi:hypothetical protein
VCNTGLIVETVLSDGLLGNIHGVNIRDSEYNNNLV